MVAPLIAGAAKVVTGAAKTTARSTRTVGGTSKAQLRAEASSARPELLRRVRSRERRKEREENPLTEEQQQAQIRRSSLLRKGHRLLQKGHILPQENGTIKKIRAASAANLIFWFGISFYIPQLSFWVFGFTGIGLELVPIANNFLPGLEIYYISWLLIFLVGLMTMIFAVVIFTMRGINSFGGWKGLIFILCFTGYTVMFINVFPWFIIWIFSVVYLQGKGEESEGDDG